MSGNIDLSRIKNDVVYAYRVVAATVNQWMGRAVSIIKSGLEKATPYMQDKRIAAISLIALTLLLSEFVNLLSYFLHKHFPNDKDWQCGIRDVIDIAGGIAIIAAGVNTFAKHTKIPFY